MERWQVGNIWFPIHVACATNVSASFRNRSRVLLRTLVNRVTASLPNPSARPWKTISTARLDQCRDSVQPLHLVISLLRPPYYRCCSHPYCYKDRLGCHSRVLCAVVGRALTWNNSNAAPLDCISENIIPSPFRFALPAVAVV